MHEATIKTNFLFAEMQRHQGRWMTDQLPKGFAFKICQFVLFLKPSANGGLADIFKLYFETVHRHNNVFQMCIVEEVLILFGPGHAKMCLMPYANNKGADQPAHPFQDSS